MNTESELREIVRRRYADPDAADRAYGELQRRWNFRRLLQEYRLQLEHGGYSVPPGRAACAIERARDRIRLEDMLLEDRASIDWEEDADSYALEGAPDVGTWLQALVTIDGETAALGGVNVYGFEDAYCRVIEAELAGEIFATLEAREAEERARWRAVGLELAA